MLILNEYQCHAIKLALGECATWDNLLLFNRNLPLFELPGFEKHSGETYCWTGLDLKKEKRKTKKTHILFLCRRNWYGTKLTQSRKELSFLFFTALLRWNGQLNQTCRLPAQSFLYLQQKTKRKSAQYFGTFCRTLPPPSQLKKKIIKLKILKSIQNE